MIFDKSKVYTAVNASELSKGDIVYLADTMSKLKYLVRLDDKNYLTTIDRIFNEEEKNRFFNKDCLIYNLAYLICPARNAEAFKAWHEGKKIEMEYAEPDENKSPAWKLFENAEPDWYEANYRPAQEQEDKSVYQIFGNMKEYRPFSSSDELIAEFVKRFGFETPEAYTYPTIWVKPSMKNNNERYLITGYIDNEENGQLVKIGGKYYGLCVLFAGFQFLDGSPCGVKIER